MLMATGPVCDTNAENTIGGNGSSDQAATKQNWDSGPINFNILVDKLDNLDWECYLLGFTGGVKPNRGPISGRLKVVRIALIRNPKREDLRLRDGVVDWEEELVIQAAQELDEEKRKAIYQKTQSITQQNLPYIYLVAERLMAAVRDRVQGIRYSDLGAHSGTFMN